MKYILCFTENLIFFLDFGDIKWVRWELPRDGESDWAQDCQDAARKKEVSQEDTVEVTSHCRTPLCTPSPQGYWSLKSPVAPLSISPLFLLGVGSVATCLRKDVTTLRGGRMFRHPGWFQWTRNYHYTVDPILHKWGVFHISSLRFKTMLPALHCRLLLRRVLDWYYTLRQLAEILANNDAAQSASEPLVTVTSGTVQRSGLARITRAE